MPRLSKGERRRMERMAAEEFFLRRARPPSQYRSPDPTDDEAAEPAQPASDLPEPGSVLGIEDSKEILRRLASGDIKQMRRR